MSQAQQAFIAATTVSMPPSAAILTSLVASL
jgi:hypothetical protein